VGQFAVSGQVLDNECEWGMVRGFRRYGGFRGMVLFRGGWALVSRGTACPNCGYVVRKFAIRCPMCRHDLTPPETAGDLARRYLKKLEERK